MVRRRGADVVDGVPTYDAQLQVSSSTLGAEASMHPGSYVLEVKCSYALRHCTTLSAVKAELHNRPDFYIREDSTTGVFTLNPDHPYFTQIQMQMACCNSDHGIFGVLVNTGTHPPRHLPAHKRTQTHPDKAHAHAHLFTRTLTFTQA